MFIGFAGNAPSCLPHRGRGTAYAVEGVYLQWQDTPPVTATGGASPLSEGAKSRFLLMLRKTDKQ